MITAAELQEIHEVMEGAESYLVDREIEIAALRGGMEIERQLAELRAGRIELFFLSVSGGRSRPHLTQGGLEASSTSLINSSMRVSNPAPATNYPNADCYDQVHVHPRGRFA